MVIDSCSIHTWPVPFESLPVLLGMHRLHKRGATVVVPCNQSDSSFGAGLPEDIPLKLSNRCARDSVVAGYSTIRRSQMGCVI